MSSMPFPPPLLAPVDKPKGHPSFGSETPPGFAEMVMVSAATSATSGRSFLSARSVQEGDSDEGDVHNFHGASAAHRGVVCDRFCLDDTPQPGAFSFDNSVTYLPENRTLAENPRTMLHFLKHSKKSKKETKRSTKGRNTRVLAGRAGGMFRPVPGGVDLMNREAGCSEVCTVM